MNYLGERGLYYDQLDPSQHQLARVFNPLGYDKSLDRIITARWDSECGYCHQAIERHAWCVFRPKYGYVRHHFCFSLEDE